MLEKPEVRLTNLFKSFDARGDIQTVVGKLLNRYAEPHRAYHDLKHVIECIDELDQINAPEFSCRPIFKTMVELALWYHDAIYDVKRKDNETQSIELCLTDCAKLNVQMFVPASEYLYWLIISTQHSTPQQTNDCQLIVDLDLMRLAANWQDFQQYSNEIWQEYSQAYTLEEYRAGRRAFLTAMLDRPHIYSTSHYRERWESKARHNLEAQLEVLKAP